MIDVFLIWFGFVAGANGINYTVEDMEIEERISSYQKYIDFRCDQGDKKSCDLWIEIEDQRMEKMRIKERDERMAYFIKDNRRY